MKQSNKPKLMRKSKTFVPCPGVGGDEHFANGIFIFNVSKILQDIADGRLAVPLIEIDVTDWFTKHLGSGHINEDQMNQVDTTKPILIAEIRPNGFNVIDGNHRLEKARREGIPSIQAYQMTSHQLLPYFTDRRGYEAYIEYWNEKVRDF